MQPVKEISSSTAFSQSPSGLLVSAIATESASAEALQAAEALQYFKGSPRAGSWGVGKHVPSERSRDVLWISIAYGCVVD